MDTVIANKAAAAVALLVLVFVATFYVYLYPTPLTEAFESARLQQLQKRFEHTR